MRSENKIVKANLEPIILKIINETPLHGYAVMKIICKRYNADFGASTIYPELEKMAQKGLLTATWQMDAKPKKIYSVTQQGKKALNSELMEFQVISNIILRENK